MMLLLGGSGKSGTPWLRMQAAYAIGSPGLEAFEEPGLAPEEPLHAEASRAATLAIASASAARLGCGPRLSAARAMRAKAGLSGLNGPGPVGFARSAFDGDLARIFERIAAFQPLPWR